MIRLSDAWFNLDKRFKYKKCKYLLEEGFDRICQKCDKKQTLKKPEQYHPSKYI